MGDVWKCFISGLSANWTTLSLRCSVINATGFWATCDDLACNGLALCLGTTTDMPGCPSPLALSLALPPGELFGFGLALGLGSAEVALVDLDSSFG